MQLLQEFTKRVQNYFKPAHIKKEEYYESFSQLAKRLEDNLPDCEIEYSASKNNGKIIISNNDNRIIIEASATIMRCSFSTAEDFLPFVSCNGIHTQQVPHFVESIKSGNVNTSFQIVKKELNRTAPAQHKKVF